MNEINNKDRIKIISENITLYRKQKNVTQKELAKKIGISQSALSDYINLRSAPSFGVIQKMADFFGVKKSDIDTTFKEEIPHQPTTTSITPQVIKLDKDLSTDNKEDWIEYGEELLEKQNNIVQLFPYNFYDSALSAGTGQFLSDVKQETITLPVSVNADFVVPIYGDSMVPEYHSGDYVFIKLTDTLKNGDIGAFELFGEAYIKELVINDDGAFLHSLNQCGDYPDILIDSDSDLRIIGEVVEKYKNHD